MPVKLPVVVAVVVALLLVGGYFAYNAQTRTAAQVAAVPLQAEPKAGEPATVFQVAGLQVAKVGHLFADCPLKGGVKNGLTVAMNTVQDSPKALSAAFGRAKGVLGL